MADRNSQTSDPHPILGVFFILMGIWPILAAFDIGPIGVDKINGPPWLGLASGGVFVATGLLLMIGDRVPIVRNLMALLIVIGLASVANWIAFGSGDRVCSGSISLPFFNTSDQYTDLGCRIPFGLGAMIVNAVLFLGLVNFLKKKFVGSSPWLDRLNKLAEALVLLTLAPFLIPVLLILFAKSFLEVLKVRLTTGTWPKNQSFIRKMRKNGN